MKAALAIFAFAALSGALFASPEIDLVRQQVDAFNRHSADDVVACYAPDIKWRNIDADTVSIEGSDCSSVHDSLVGYFQKLPSVHSDLLEINQTGPHVVFRERARWKAKDGSPREQTAIGVFEVRDRLVVRAWYFPAVVSATPSP